MMIDDFEDRVMYGENVNSTSDKFSLTHFSLNEEQRNETIIAMCSSKKNIFFLTENHNLFLVDSISLQTINELYSLNEPKEANDFKEKDFNKIWSDREGNHCIIRHNNAIYYFNNSLKETFELNKIGKLEICAVSLDDKNTDLRTTKNFLAVDYDNKIYECCVDIISEGKNKKEKIKDSIEELTCLDLIDPNYEDEEDSNDNRKSFKQINDRIYGIKFFHSINNVDQGEDSCYIIAVTKNRLYQFTGPGLKSFKQILSRYDRNPSLLNDVCKHFPRNKNKFKVEFDILYKIYNKIDVFSQFGWRTYTGYCWSNFIYDKNYKNGGLPLDLKDFTIIPFEKITEKGKKETDLNPISVVHSGRHLFFLYEDCLTIISKLSSNIIHTEYLSFKFDQMIYHEFSKDNGIILLNSRNGLYKISLKKENSDIWKDYLELGDFKAASNLCNSEKIKQKINRINAEEEFIKNKKMSRAEAAQLYAYSDEKFEVVCLRYLMEKDLDGLQLYLECYRNKNLNLEDNQDNKDKILQLKLINTWLIEITLNKENLDIKDFRGLIRETKKNISEELVYQTLLNYGKSKEYLAFASILGDFERATIYYLNQGQILDAVELLREFASYDDPDTLKILLDIFIENSHLFFKEDPSGSIELLNTFINNNIELNENIMENVIQALMSRTDKDNIKAKKKEELIEGKKAKLTENIRIILSYLKSLMDHSGQNKAIKSKIKEQLNNIHNLYIYYLSINPANKVAVIEYLKKYLEVDQRGKRKQKVLFQLDYAKRLLKDNKLAYALVLALMGKYSEGVYYALKRDPNKKDDVQFNQEIAEFIANSATDNKLKKKLWIEIFRNYSESGEDNQDSNKEERFTQAIKIMEKSEVLKIEDVLPHITDSIKIEEFKKQISECISQYEQKINGLKKNIKTYNDIAENIKSDISKIKKRSMELKYNEFKCEICKGYIKNKNIFLFPCGHMFDMNCIRECLLNYEITGLDYLHNDNLLIDKLSYQLGYIPKRVFVDSNAINKKEEYKKGDDKKNKKMKEIEMINEEMMSTENKKELKESLNNCLSKQCVLCGDFLVDSVQCSLNQRKKMVDSYGFKLSLPPEPDFMF